MRAVLVVVVGTGLAGCQAAPSLPTEVDGNPGGGFIDPGSGFETSGCHVDTDCAVAGNVCARDGACAPAADVHAIKVTWTVHGQPAAATTCAAFPSLYLDFDGTGTFGFAPVPCSAGAFPIDKLETRYTQASIGVDDSSGRQVSAPIDPTTGLATLDLQF